MTAAGRRVTAGFVGRPHGLDGSFYLERPSEPVSVGTEVRIGDRAVVVERRAGTDEHPIIRVGGVSDRDSAGGLRGLSVLVDAGDLEAGEYFVDDLVGCEVRGLGEVRRVVPAPSCDLLEVGENALLVPLVSDAVTRVDLKRRLIEVDRAFLGLDDTP